MAMSKRDETAAGPSVQMNVRGADDLGPVRDVSLEHLGKLLRGCHQRLRPLLRQEFLHRVGIEQFIDISVDLPGDRRIDLRRRENAPPGVYVESGISALGD